MQVRRQVTGVLPHMQAGTRYVWHLRGCASRQDPEGLAPGITHGAEGMLVKRARRLDHAGLGTAGHRETPEGTTGP